MQVHVWWPACESPNEAMGAAFYPAEMRAPATGTAAADGDFVLQFARGEFVVSAECVFPVENPIAFGGETVPIRVRSAPLLSAPSVDLINRWFPDFSRFVQFLNA